jgi:hypothetical protein
MIKKPIFGVSIMAVILLVLGSITPVLASEEKPDLIITGVSYIFIFGDTPCLTCTIKNDGTAPVNDFFVEAKGGRFLLHKRNTYYNEGLDAGSTVEKAIFVPGPYFGIYRLHLHISTNTTEEDTSNNYFYNSYFIICLTVLHVWIFEEFPH